MAILPELRPIRLEAYKNVPDWAEATINTLNRFMRDVFYALSALTFDENFAALVREVKFTTMSTYTAGDFTPIAFRVEQKTRVTGVLLLQLTQVADPAEKFLAGVSLTSWSTDQETVKINYIAGLANNVRYKIVVLIF